MAKKEVEPDPIDDPSKRLSAGNFGRIARRTGFTEQHISRVCRGLREPSFDVAAVIAEAAGVTLDQLHAHTMKFRASTAGYRIPKEV